jgi:uncharacterized protein (DUF302 family)
MIGYGFTKELNLSFDQAIKITTEELKKEGFGIISQIDLKEKFKEKLGIDFKRYIILGACHPASAHNAILAEENIGLMLPCNVIVYEKDGKTVVSIITPTVTMEMIKNEELKKIAESVETKLKKVFDSIK